MVTYDKSIIQKFAEKLYAQARSIIILAAILGFIVGAAVAASIPNAKIGAGEAALGGALGALLGIAWGRSRAFVLKLQAQTALCQAQIEENTRPETAAAVQRVA